MARSEKDERTSSDSPPPPAYGFIYNQEQVKDNTAEVDILLQNKSHDPKTPEDVRNNEEILNGDTKQEIDFWKLPFRSKFQFIKNNISVEPLIFFYIFSGVMSSVAVQNLYLEKACRVNMAYGDEVCDAIARRDTQNYTQQELVVQQLTAQMVGLKTLAANSLPIVFILFAGSWSDRNGRRKPLMFLPTIGEVCNTMGLLVNTYFFYELPMEAAAWTESVFLALSGGWITAFVAAFSYIADVSSEETRTARIGLVNLCSLIALPLGSAISGICYERLGFYGVLWISVALYALAVFLGYILVHETPKPKSVANPRNRSFLRDFFDATNVKETLKVTFKRRKENHRLKIILVMITLILVTAPGAGEFSVLYLFLRLRLHWDDIQFSMCSTFGVIMNLIGTGITVGFLSQILKFHDTIIGILSCISKILANSLYASASVTWMMYVGATADLLNGSSGIAIRSIISKLVPSNEIGQVNSVFGVCDAIVPLIFVPLYTTFYNYTVEIFPGAFWLIGIGIKLLAMAIFGWMYVDYRNDKKYGKHEVKESGKALPDENCSLPGQSTK